jgi:NAD(P)-dependent dehydrogenase (short-subunit alcohol dehydrogenase family)
MQISLAGKVAIVTGVSGEGQVGQAVARALAENGAQLAICARKQSNVEARAKELRDAGARVFAMVGSLTDEGQVQRLIDGTVSEYGQIDVLVNLAGGLSRYKTAVEHSLDDWRAEVDNNLLSAFLTSRAAFPHLQAAGTGVIINFARAGQPRANMIAYNCAKAGIEALTRTLALEGRDLSIRVNAIAPGLGRHGIQHCRDETERSEALDQARRYRRDRALPCLASRRRHHRPSRCGHRLGTVTRWPVFCRIVFSCVQSAGRMKQASDRNAFAQLVETLNSKRSQIC